jgi:hypothetical protein
VLSDRAHRARSIGRLRQIHPFNWSAILQHLLSLIIFLALIPACAFGAFQFQKHQGRLPMEMEEFQPFLPAALRKQAIWLGIAVLAELFGGLAIGIIVLMFAVLPWLFWNPASGGKLPGWKELDASAKADNAQWLAALGANPLERAKAIEAMFEQKAKTISVSHFERWSDKSYDQAVPDLIHYIRFNVGRSLAAMDFREREALRFAEHFNSIANGENKIYARWRAALVWGDGKGSSLTPTQYLNLNGDDPIRDFLAKMGLNVASTINAISIHAGQVKDDPNQPQALRAVGQEAFQAISGGAG